MVGDSRRSDSSETILPTGPSPSSSESGGVFMTVVGLAIISALLSGLLILALDG